MDHPCLHPSRKDIAFATSAARGLIKPLITQVNEGCTPLKTIVVNSDARAGGGVHRLWRLRYSANAPPSALPRALFAPAKKSEIAERATKRHLSALPSFFFFFYQLSLIFDKFALQPACSFARNIRVLLLLLPRFVIKNYYIELLPKAKTIERGIKWMARDKRAINIDTFARWRGSSTLELLKSSGVPENRDGSPFLPSYRRNLESPRHRDAAIEYTCLGSYALPCGRISAAYPRT